MQNTSSVSRPPASSYSTAPPTTPHHLPPSSPYLPNPSIPSLFAATSSEEPSTSPPPTDMSNHQSPSSLPLIESSTAPRSPSRSHSPESPPRTPQHSAHSSAPSSTPHPRGYPAHFAPFGSADSNNPRLLESTKKPRFLEYPIFLP